VPVGSIWRDGAKLVIVRNAGLPERCFKCNAPAEGYRLKQTVSWNHPALLLFLLLPPVGLIVLIVVALSTRKTELRIGACRAHRGRPRLCITGMGMFLVGIVGMIGGAGFVNGSAGMIFPISFVLLPVGIVTAMIGARIVKAVRITKQRIFLKGFHPDYLAEFPEWPGK
jgi:hypothetical protein